MEYDSTLLVRLFPPVPAAFLAGTFAAFFPTAGVLAIFGSCWWYKLWQRLQLPNRNPEITISKLKKGKKQFDSNNKKTESLNSKK